MTEETLKSSLRVLTDNQDIQVIELSNDTYLIESQNQNWLLWPLSRRWAACDQTGTQLGELHFGSIAAFNNKEIKKLPGIPENHQKKWTIEELKTLATLVDANFTVTDTCSIMKRTEWSIVSKLSDEYGVSLDHKKGNSSLGSEGLRDLLKSTPN